MPKYNDEELELIAQYINGFVRQDDDGNVVWNNSPDAESGWRPLYVSEAWLEAIKAESKRCRDSI